MAQTTKFTYGKFGLKHDPRGAHVTVKYQGRLLLGEVMAVDYDEIRCGQFLTVRHFNGDDWPIKPCAASVDVLVRA